MTLEAGSVFVADWGGDESFDTHKAARYVGCSWGAGGAYFKISFHKNINHRQRTMARKYVYNMSTPKGFMESETKASLRS
jgi:hypothetical protein